MATFKSNVGNGYYLWLETTNSGHNISNNTSVVNYKLWIYNATATFDAATTGSLSINGRPVWTTSARLALLSWNSSLLLASGSTIVSHNADGKKSVSVAASFKTNTQGTVWAVPSLSLSGSMTLNTIPRTSKPSLSHSSRDLGSAITIYTNRASTSFTHTVAYSIGNKSGTIATGVGASTSWTLPANLAEEILTSRSRAGTITVTTYNGSTRIGSASITFTATVPDTATYRPVATIVKIAEAATLPAIFGATDYIQTKSKLKVDASATFKYGTSVNYYRITIDGIHYNRQSATSDFINKSGGVVVTVMVVDKRGLSNSVSQTVQFIPYHAPEITVFNVERYPNDQANKVSVGYATNRSNVNGKNTRTIIVDFRLAGNGGSWTQLFKSENNAMTDDNYSDTRYPTNVFSTDNSFDFRLRLSDAFETVEFETSIGTAFELINWNNSGRGMAIGKVSERDTLEVGLDAEFFKDVLVYDNDIYLHGGKVLPNEIIDGRNKMQTPRYYLTNYKNRIVSQYTTAGSVGLTVLFNLSALIIETRACEVGETSIVVQIAYANDNEVYNRTGINETWNKWSAMSLGGEVVNA